MKKGQDQKELPETDHRRIGQKLDLFSFHDIAPGAPFWHPKGMLIFRELERIIREINDGNNYAEIQTPILAKSELFKKSGHWKLYRELMFHFKNPRDKKEQLVVKPMNCPESAFIYNSKIRSHRDLPLRLAELAPLHRNEPSGTLGGLLRVRRLTVDDAHIYCRPDQVTTEIENLIKISDDFYGLFNIKPNYYLATRPEKFLGAKTDWDKAEGSLKNALDGLKIKYKVAAKEGAFYGPKVEVHLLDSQKRDWQMGTIQLDLVMLPQQFNVKYVDQNGKKQMPYVIHRAILGSFERFIGMILEHTGGSLPFWLSPVQIALLTVADAALEYGRRLTNQFKKQGYRILLDDRNETIGKKIREAELQKIPFILIVGEREISANAVAVRERGKGDLGQMALEKFIDIINPLLVKS